MVSEGLTGARKVGGVSACGEAVLDRWARRDAAMAFAAENGIPASTFRKIIERARSAGDERAVYVIGERAGQAPQAKLPPPLHKAMGISTRTVFATMLGTGSVACRRIAVSISCLPTERNI